MNGAALVAQVPGAQTGSPKAIRNVKANARPQLLLLAMPDPDFRVALECGLLLTVRGLDGMSLRMCDGVGEVCNHVNALFEKRGVPYRLDHELKLNFKGDAEMHAVVVVPALTALADPRLAGARSEFETL